MKFSFVIPAYKSEKTILNCLKGIFNQTVLDEHTYEIIIVLCNPSTELECLIPNKSNIVTLKTNKKNRSLSRNLGSDYSKGEYIIFVDSDVYLFPNWIRYQIKIFENKLVAASQGQFIWDQNSNTKVIQSAFKPTIQTTLFSEYGPIIVTGACIYRSSIFKAIGQFNNSILWNEDLNLSIKAFNLGYALAYRHSAIAVLLNEKYSFLKCIKRGFKSGFYTGKLNKYYYNTFKFRYIFSSYMKRLTYNLKLVLQLNNSIFEIQLALINVSKLIGYLASIISFSNSVYDFPKITNTYKGIKNERKGILQFGLLYINGKRSLYNPNNRELKWMK